MTDRDGFVEQSLELIGRLESGPVYLTHKEAYDLALRFGSDTALGLAVVIRKAFAGASLDAALALAERLWSHAMWRVGHDPDDGSFKAELVIAQKPGDPPAVQANAATPALALCIAILKARPSSGTGSNEESD